MRKNGFFPRTCDLLVSQRTTQRHCFSTLHSVFPVIFAAATVLAFYCFTILGSASILYTAWSNAYSEIGPEVTLRPLATSCSKDYKGHSLVQTSSTEPPSSAILCSSSRADSLRSCCMWLNQRAFLISTEALLVVKWLTLREAAAVSAQVLYTPFKQAPVYSVTLFKAILVGCMCVLAVACHLHFWQNDCGCLRATALTRG